jgi:hypothetical protein
MVAHAASENRGRRVRKHWAFSHWTVIDEVRRRLHPTHRRDDWLIPPGAFGITRLNWYCPVYEMPAKLGVTDTPPIVKVMAFAAFKSTQTIAYDVTREPNE